MRKRLALLALGLSALAQEVAVYPGFAEVKEPVDLSPAVLLPEGYRLEAVLDPMEARSFRYRLTLPR